MQTIWGDPDRYVKIYYSKYSKKPGSKRWQDWIYESGDGALITKDGYVRILGRIDDVINVSGHRLGTKEIESACLELPVVAEAAVVAQKDDIKGHVPIAFVSLNKTTKNNEEVKNNIVKNIEHLVGKIARPKEVYIVADMPKTRSGKIMRRVLASLVNNSEVGDVSTLDNPDSVKEIQSVIKLN
jgi:acetyl-CoA synthetase